MNKLLLIVFFAGVASAASSLNYSVWDNFYTTQGRQIENTTQLGIQYYENYNVSSWNKLIYSIGAGAWDSTAKIIKGAYPIIEIRPSGADVYDAITFASTSYAGNLTINGSVASACLGACDVIAGIKRFNSDDTLNATLYTFEFKNATAYLQVFTLYNVAMAAGQKIRFMADTAGGPSNDRVDFSNTTIKGNATYGLIVIGAFDEFYPANQKTFNVTISNATNSTTYNAIDFGIMFNKTYAEVPSGVINIELRNSTCQTGNILPRAYGVNTVTDYLNFSAFLLCDGSTPALTTFFIQALNGGRIPGARLNASKVINGVQTSVTSGITDSVGGAALYLDVNTLYQISVQATGYTDSVAYIQPTAGTYTVYMTQGSNSLGFQTQFDGLLFQNTPDNSYLYGNYSNLTFYVNDAYNLLNFWGWRIWYQGTIIYTLNQSSTSGGFDWEYLQLDNKDGNVTAEYFFDRAAFGTFTYNRTYIINPSNATAGSFVNAAASLKANGASNFFIVLIAAVIIAFVTAPFSAMVHDGAGAIALLLWGLVAYTGGLSWTLFGLTAVGFVSYIAMIRIQ